MRRIRPISGPVHIRSEMVTIESSGLSDIGKKRRTNEDAFLVDEEHDLYLVADGMGGHAAGDVASAVVVETMRDYIQRAQTDLDLDTIMDSDPSLSTLANRLQAAVRLANRGVFDLASQREDYHGMGATVAAAYHTGNTMIVANVGDSPIFLIQRGHIEQVSITHNVITEQMAINPAGADQIAPEFHGRLTRAMGVEPQVEVDVFELPVFPGDRLIICSDGLSEKVPPEEMLELSQNRPDTAEICQALVSLANARGGDDNITVVALSVQNAVKQKGGVWNLIKRLCFRKTA